MTDARLFTPAAFAGGLLLVAAFACGMFFGGYQDIIYAPAVIALLAFTLLAVLPGCWRGLPMPSSVTALLVFALWLYVTVSLTWSTVPFASLVTYLIALALPLTFFGLLMARDRTAWMALAGGMLLVAVVAAGAWAVIQGLFLSAHYFRAGHPLPNPNSLGALLNLGLMPLLAGYTLRPRIDARAGFWLAAAALVFAGIVATQSRGALCAALVAAPLLLFLLRSGWRRALLVLAVMAAVFGAMQLAPGPGMAARLAHVATPDHPENTMAPRMALWGAALEMARERPLTGTGLGTFYLYYPAHRPPLTDNSAGNWAHNDPLQFAVEMGIAAPLLLYAVMLAALARTIRALRRERAATWRRAAIAAPACALLTLAIDAHVSFPLYLIPITICAGVLLAVWHDATARALGAPERTVHFHGWQQSFMGIMAIAIAAMLALMASSSAAGMHYLQRARDAMARGDVAGFIENVEKADNRSPSSFIDPQVQVAGLYTDMLTPPAGLITAEEQVTLRDETLNLLASAEKLNPAWAEIDYRRGRLYAVTGAYGLTENGAALAEEQYKTALSKNPMHYRAREDLARALAARGDAAGAFDLLAAGLEYPLPEAVNDTYLPLLRQLQALADVQKKYRPAPPQEPPQEPPP